MNRADRDTELRTAFERLSTDYDARFPRIIPRYAEFHQVIVQRVAEHPARQSGARVVDLGCGTGELSRRLLEAVPDVRLHCVDLAPAMIERAREKLRRWGDRVSFEVANVLLASLPADVSAVISALAIHHLDASEKLALFGKVRACLTGGGLFVMGDAVDGETPFTTGYYIRRWVEHMRSAGMGEDEIASVLQDHEQNDRFSTLSAQTGWLREVGLEGVECLWKHFLLVVIAAEKADAETTVK